MTDYQTALRHFLDDQGRLKRWPAKRKIQVAAAAYLAQQFLPGREYAEAEVNEILNRCHTFKDPALLRRSLFDEGHLARTPDGRRYWRTTPEA